MPNLYFFIRNLCLGNLGPKKFGTSQNCRKFRTKKKAVDSLWFSCRVDFHVAGLFIRQVGGPHGCSLFLVLNSRKFWTEILPGQPQKICRRVKTLALEAIGPGLDSRLQRALLSGASVSGGCLAMSLAMAGWVCGWLAMWLIGYLAGSFCEWLLCGSMAVAGWLACYAAAHVAGWLCGLLAGFGAQWLWLACPPPTWLADSWLGCWLPTWLAVKLLAG